ncbi:hypothetical protein RN001_000559 [Aquatica leii]|uniref:Flavin-containing monooxygenase n=1 Tax=Aquatica leii TaxID=1421715 RepID=A0AAN7PFH2_9COLE|nr:hypothetical protein RN001_000559 [Aquatica leii]
MKVAIIGAGVAGIASLKYVSEAGYECDCYEETESYGGTWVYTDKAVIDDDGFPVYRNMYKDLITNLPRQLMTLSDVPYDNSKKNVYLKQPEVLEYLTKFVNMFKLESSIKYRHQVIKIEPHDCHKWLLIAKHLKNNITTSKVYDFVFVCNGHCRYPRVPKIIGKNLFEGLQMHSRDFRNPIIFKSKRVLIIGAANSGTDISQKIQKVAKTIFISHWKPILAKVHNSISKKPTVTKFTKNTAIFSDGTAEEIDAVVYCTGYEYKFPFLPASTGITVSNNWVKPLYKHIVNIEYPTMFFIGIPFFSAAFLVSDIQARFAVSVIEKKTILPSKSEMLHELNNYITKLRMEKIPQRHVHKLGYKQKEYFDDLDKTASLVPFPPVYNNLYEYLRVNINSILGGKKSYMFVGNETFIEN